MTEQPQEPFGMRFVGRTTQRELDHLSDGPGSVGTLFPVDAEGFSIRLYAVANVDLNHDPSMDDLIPREAWVHSQRECEYWRNRAQTMYRHSVKDVWFWQDDYDNNLDSMVSSLPVVITAGVLRRLLKANADDHNQTLKAQLDEADRRAGAAERELASVRSELESLRRVRDQQKKQAGYDTNVSFDVVWTEILTKAQKDNDGQSK